MENPNQTILLTVADCCTRLQIGRTKFYALVNAGELQTIKIGSATRVTMASVQEFVARAVANNDNGPAALVVGMAK